MVVSFSLSLSLVVFSGAEAAPCDSSAGAVVRVLSSGTRASLLRGWSDFRAGMAVYVLVGETGEVRYGGLSLFYPE